MAFYDRMMKIDRRIIYLCMTLAVAIPLLVPIGMPVQVSDESRGFYDHIEDLEAGDIVLLSFDYEGDVMAELNPMSIAALRHLFRQDVRVVSVTMYAGGTGIAQDILDETAAEFGKEYGVDYVFLGYNPDWSGTMLRLGESFRATYPADQYGTSVREIPLMQEVETYDDIELLVSIAGSALSEYWAIWAGGRYGVTVISGNTAIQAILIYPYYNAGQIPGFLGGLKGAAEYEKLVDRPGLGIKGMDAQSVAHLLMLSFIVIGNIGYFLSRRHERKLKEE
jgi:hypothetical protein